MCVPAQAPRVLEISTPLGPGVSRGSGTASGDGQLWDTQNARGAAVVGASPPVCHSFHPDQFELGQFGGAMVWGTNPQSGPPRCVCERDGFDPSHRCVSGCLERESQTICM